MLDAASVPAKPIPFPSASKDKRFVIFAASCVRRMRCVRSRRRRAGSPIRRTNRSRRRAARVRARWLSGVRVYDEDSTRALAKTCRVSAIPSGCLLDGDRPLWIGNPDDGAAVLDGFLSGHLDDVRARQKNANVVWKKAVDAPEKRPEAVAALHGLAGQENSVAWELVDSSNASPGELALAVELARDAAESTSALDFAILDTYELGLSKTGNDAEAARVARRVIALCDAVKGECTEERARAEAVLKGK